MQALVNSTFSSIHDLTFFRRFKVRLPVEMALIADAGDQGVWKDHPRAITTHTFAGGLLMTESDRCLCMNPQSFSQAGVHQLN